MKTYLILFVILLIIFAVQSVSMKKAAAQKLRKELDKRWGKRPDRAYTHEEYERISHYYQHAKKPEDICIDDITWNDISMDDVFKEINHTLSSVGEESLYRRLRTLRQSGQDLEKFGKMMHALRNILLYQKNYKVYMLPLGEQNLFLFMTLL